MRTFLFLNNLILILALLQSSGNYATSASAKSELEADSLEALAAPRRLAVSLTSATETTIKFQTERNEKVKSPEPEEQEIPHLVLNRNGVPTPGFERTLVVSLENIDVPVGGAYAQLVIESQHGDPDLGGGKANRIQLYEDTKFIPYKGESAPPAWVDFQVVFQRTFQHFQKETRTPTDYFNYRIRLTDSDGDILKEFRDEYAFLMENQWRVPLPEVLEAAPGAAPNELVIYYYDMIPFQTDLRDPFTQVARYDVDRYIQTELVPEMVAAFETQTNLWNLPWYEEWSNSRTDEDPKSLSVALTEYGTWYHGTAPSLGHAMISIRVDGSFGEYSDLTDGLMSVFHHELFHNQQRNISLHFGSRGNLAGKEEVWKVFSEGTAVLASSVGQPMIQFQPSAQLRSYAKRANAFIGSEGVFGGGLNKSYREIPYHTALYWRFLYENCGGLVNSVEDPAAGIQIIRNILETLYKGEIADINSSTDVARALPQIVNTALDETPACRFTTYEESLVEFAKAIHKLRLEDATCTNFSHAARCGFFDPYKLYTAPQADGHPIGAGSTLVNGSIPSSYGIDLLELALDESAEGKSLKVIFQAASSPQDEFRVVAQGIRIRSSETGILRSPVQNDPVWSARTANGLLILEIPSLNLEAFNALGMIVIRTDPYETNGSQGNYTIQILVE